jgi:hypothetical protein
MQQVGDPHDSFLLLANSLNKQQVKIIQYDFFCKCFEFIVNAIERKQSSCVIKQCSLLQSYIANQDNVSSCIMLHCKLVDCCNVQ